MWTIENIPGYDTGNRYLIRNTRSGGYLSDNGVNGGAIHFIDREECEIVVHALNLAETK